MRHLSLFAGVGMTDIATQSFGFETVAFAEIDPFNQRVLRQRLPGASGWSDVRNVTASASVKSIDLISGGFPCQDLSRLGAARGLAGQRSGLWTEFARVVGQFEPRYVLIENVAALRSRGLHTVVTDLANLGYDVLWDCIPAGAVGALHMRDRIWIVAVRHDAARFRVLPLPIKLPRAGLVLRDQFRPRKPRAMQRDVKAAVRQGHMLLPPQWVSRPPYHPLSGHPERKGEPFAALYPRHTPRRNMLLPIPDQASGLWPTPRRSPNEWRTTQNAPSHGNTHGATLAGSANDLERRQGRQIGLPSESAGNISPRWVEWLMGLPEGWTNPELSNSELLPFVGWDWEPLPRTETNALHRRARLTALGNGLVPHAAVEALHMMFDLEGERT